MFFLSQGGEAADIFQLTENDKGSKPKWLHQNFKVPKVRQM